MKKGILITVFAVLAAPAFATIELPDQFDVAGSASFGLGRVAASFETILDEVGYVVDDTFDGEMTFCWTMKWNTVGGVDGTARRSWATFHFYSDRYGELCGIGNAWASSNISTFNEEGVGPYTAHQSGVTVEPDKEYSFRLEIDYHAGAPDTAVLNGGGFVNQRLTAGDWGFHHIRVRTGPEASRVDFTNMSITSRGVGGVGGTEADYEPVDPRFPSEWNVQQAKPRKDWSRWPRTRIQQLEMALDQLHKKISVLPQHTPRVLSDHLGYHSLFTEPGDEGSLSLNQIDINLSWSPRLGSIAMAPAFNPEDPGTYAFPRRFKIEVFNTRTKGFETVVDWMEEDFPDPGPYPVFFAGINRFIRQVRITVPDVADQPFFALGEVYLFRQKEDGQIGDNMATWGSSTVEVSASGALTRPPMWSLQYLNDGEDGFGFPLSDEVFDRGDLMIENISSSALPDRVQLVLDLGQIENVGRIDFWPAVAPRSMALPSFGFPQEIRLELSRSPDFVEAQEIEMRPVAEELNRGKLLSTVAKAYPARYVRVTLSALEQYNGNPILGIGEILLTENGENLSIGCTVSEQGIPAEYKDQLVRLVDGCSRGRRILPQGEWIKGLALRRPLDRQLAVVELELEKAREKWRKIQQRFGLWIGVAIFMSLAGGLVIQQRMRRRGINRLKVRIARDLHDDVGSILGGISFSTEQLKHVVENEKAKETLRDLSLMASEACASLREVVWVIDGKTIRLPALIEKMIERADRVLRGTGVSVETSVECPDCIVSLTYKRHLIMFFKEVVHNCARHAQATQVWVDFSWADQHLQISVRDNGCGFDSSKKTDGWGLGSMKDRAEEMGGQMELTSQPGQGTSVVLTIPLTAFLSKTDHLYKTSN